MVHHRTQQPLLLDRLHRTRRDLHRSDLTSLANSMDFVSLASIVFLPWLCRKSSKRNVWAVALAAAVGGQIIVHFGVSSQSIPLVFAGWIVGFLASGLAMAMPFFILSDTVDYGEWKSGVRATGLLTAIGAAFCLKAGSGLGGALPAWILQHYAYVPNVQQTTRSLFGIDLCVIWLPALFYALATIPVLFYHPYERLEDSVRNELTARRAAAAALSSAV
jgi:Na+/melibiose symporter-like transporter